MFGFNPHRVQFLGSCFLSSGASPPPFFTQEESGPGRAGHVLEMATDALTAFLEKDFQRAEAELSALSKDDADDPRIRHNALVTRFYSHRAQEDVDDLVLFVASFVPDDASLSKHAFFDRVESDPALCKTIYSKVGPVALYNVTIIAYIEAYVQSAAALGAALYLNVEAMEDWLALKTCFLLADVYLRLGNVSEAATVAAYAEKLLPSFAKQSTPQSGQSVSSQPQSEMKVLAPKWSGRGKAVLDSPSSYEDANFCMHIYNARLSAAFDGTRSIRKEAKSAVFAADDSDSRPTSAALLIKSRVEPNLSKSLRILASIGTQCPPHIMKKVRPLTLNSLGILHHRLGRHSVAAVYFEHARRAFLQLFAEDDQSPDDSEDKTLPVYPSVLSSVNDTHVCYNLALQNFKLGDYSRALELFSVSARADKTLATNSPMLWIRMAECCVGLESTAAENRQSLAVEGFGRGRRLIMRSEERGEGLGMEYASTCARGAIEILDRLKAESGSTGVERSRADGMISGTGTRQGKPDVSDSSPIHTEMDSNWLRGAALSLLAYSSLSFDADSAINACDQLIKMYPQADNERGVLGRLYSAEALCLLGRADEAANRLAPLMAMSISNESNFKEAAYINMALSQMGNKDFAAAARAAKIALKIAVQKGSKGLRQEASFVAAYIFLRNDDAETARQLLRSLLVPVE